MNAELDKIHPETGLPVRDVLAEQFRREAVTEANADPLPGPLALAFPARAIRVGGFSIRPVHCLDIPILRGLNSPLMRQFIEASKPKEQQQPTSFTDEDGWDMVLQFLLTPDQAQAEFAKGPEPFRRLARAKISGMNPLIMNQLVEAVARQFAEMMITAVKFNATETEQPLNETVFTTPPPARKTASAGGSNSSAV